MLTPNINRIKHVHLIGIGGSGMSGLAEVLLNQGYIVSGSDISVSKVTQRLSSLGIKVFYSHDYLNISDADAIVVSSAIDINNPEIKAAHDKRIPVLARAQMLGELMRLKDGIAIAGTHGKTTTTSLVTSLLTAGGLDPTFVIGGLLNSAGTHAKLGGGKYFIAEADESDASFLYLQPKMAIVTNVDCDHMQTYASSFEVLQQTFVDFLHRLPFFGLAVVCIDDPVICRLLPKIGRPLVTYGFDYAADYRAVDFRQIGIKCEYTLRRKKHKDLKINLNLPGEHNVLNSLAAIVVAKECGVAEDDICRALAEFQGVGRRFQISERLFAGGRNVTLIDDYGHHPREIAVTIDTIRKAWPDRRLVTAFQPHRYSRTCALFDDFAHILSNTDVLLLLDIYSAGEQPIAGISGRALARNIRQRGKVEPVFVAQLEDLSAVLGNVLEDGDVLLMQGAGSIGKFAAELSDHSLLT